MKFNNIDLQVSMLKRQMSVATDTELDDLREKLRVLENPEGKAAAKQKQNITSQTKTYLKNELTELITAIVGHAYANIDSIEENSGTYKEAEERILARVGEINDEGLSQDERDNIIGNITQLFKNIEKILIAREEIVEIGVSGSSAEKDAKIKKRNETVESSKEAIKNSPTDLKEIINKIVIRKELVIDSTTGSLGADFLSECKAAADEALYENGNFNEQNDIKRFHLKDIQMLTRKIKGLDAYTCRIYLEDTIKIGNIPLAYELTKRLLSFNLEEDKPADLYKKLLIIGIEVFNNADIAGNDPRKIFFSKNAKEFVKHIERDGLLSIQKTLTEHSNDKPAFLKTLLLESLNSLPRAYSLSDFKLEGKIQHQGEMDLNRIADECIAIKQLEKDLRDKHNQEFSDRKYINNIYKFLYALKRGMKLSKNDLEAASKALMHGNLKASAEVDGEETKSTERDSEDQIKDKIKAALGRIGILESELSKADLFKVIERGSSITPFKDSGSDRSSPILSDSDREVDPGARVASTGRKTSFTNQAGVRLKPVSAGNAWHTAATSDNAVKKLQEVRIGKDQIATQDRSANTAIHALFGNKLIDATALKKAAQILFSNYRDEKGADELAVLVNAVNGDADTALHLLCKNLKIKGEDLAELLVILRRNGADLTTIDKAQQTALHIICSRKEEIPAVQYLTSSNRGENKPNVNAKDSLGYTAAYLAAKYFNMETYNHLSENTKADRYVKRDDNKEIYEILEDGYPNTAQAFIETYGQNKDSLRKQKQNIDNGELENLKTAILADPNIIHIIDENGDSLLHHAARKENINIVNLLVEKGANILLPNSAGYTPLDLAVNKIMIEALFKGDAAIREYRARQDENSKDKSYYQGVIAATGAAVVGSHIINYPKDLGSLLAAGVTSLGIAAAAGAAVWGAGRLGHECWTQYKEGGDANISDSYYMESNFSKSWKDLQDLEKDSGLSGGRLDYLKELEEKIVKETKKNYPDIVEIGEGLLKANLFRQSMFKGQENAEALSNKGEELVGHFNKWKEVQKGRDVSEGLKIFYDSVTTSAYGVAAGGAAIMLSDSKVAIGASAVTAIGASWVNRIKNTGVKEGKKSPQH